MLTISNDQLSLDFENHGVRAIRFDGRLITGDPVRGAQLHQGIFVSGRAAWNFQRWSYPDLSEIERGNSHLSFSAKYGTASAVYRYGVEGNALVFSAVVHNDQNNTAICNLGIALPTFDLGTGNTIHVSRLKWDELRENADTACSDLSKRPSFLAGDRFRVELASPSHAESNVLFNAWTPASGELPAATTLECFIKDQIEPQGTLPIIVVMAFSKTEPK